MRWEGHGEEQVGLEKVRLCCHAKIWNVCLESKYRDGVGGWISLEFRGEIWSTDRNSEMAKVPE